MLNTCQISGSKLICEQIFHLNCFVFGSALKTTRLLDDIAGGALTTCENVGRRRVLEAENANEALRDGTSPVSSIMTVDGVGRLNCISFLGKRVVRGESELDGRLGVWIPEGDIS